MIVTKKKKKEIRERLKAILSSLNGKNIIYQPF